MVEDLVVIGRVTRPHGVRGEIRVLPFTESPASFKRFDRVILRQPNEAGKSVRVKSARPHKTIVLLQLEGMRTREEAERWCQAEILVRRDWLPELESHEYYWADLIGLSAYDEAGRFVGDVERVISTKGDDILVLNHDCREVLLPFRTENVLEVDVVEKRLLVQASPGLLDL